MNLIPCNAQCRYQVEGCCTLHKAEAVNSVQKGCVYFVPREKSAKRWAALTNHCFKRLADSAHTDNLDLIPNA